jgi:hypothetical protein
MGNVADLTQFGGATMVLNRDRSGSLWGTYDFFSSIIRASESVNYAPIPISDFTNRTGSGVTCGTAAGASGTLCVSARDLVSVHYPGTGPLTAVFGIPPQ